MSGRRSLLGAAAAVVATPLAQGIAATASPLPDAELIRLCSEYVSIQERWNVCSDDAEGDKLDALQTPLFRQIMQLPCTTLGGFQALAAALAVWDLELLKPGSGDVGTVMAANLVRRLLALENMA